MSTVNEVRWQQHWWCWSERQPLRKAAIQCRCWATSSVSSYSTCQHCYASILVVVVVAAAAAVDCVVDGVTAAENPTSIHKNLA